MAVLRAGLYERVSTEEQAIHGFSIETQIANLTDFCNANSIKIVDHYADEGISGAKPPMKRPALKRLLDDVVSGKIDIILFTKLDRWFRSVKEYFKVQDILDQNSVQWKAIQEDYDTTTPNGQLAITIFMAIAQNERDKTAARVKDVLEHKRKNKEACFGGKIVPFGYKKIKDENGVTRLARDESSEQAVKDFWRIMVEENNFTKAIRRMADFYGIRKDWKSWKRMVHSDFYCGVHKGVEDFCEPYVSREDWQRIQEQKPVKQTASGSHYYFRGLMRCPECGHILCGDTDKRKPERYKSYRCNYRSRGCSNTASISERKIEKQLLDKLTQFMNDEVASAEVAEADQRKKPNELKSLKEKHRRLTVAYMAGNIDDEEYLRSDQELKAKIKKAETENTAPKRDLSAIKILLETDFVSLYQMLTDERKQQFWQRLIAEIRLDGKTVAGVSFRE